MVFWFKLADHHRKGWMFAMPYEVSFVLNFTVIDSLPRGCGLLDGEWRYTKLQPYYHEPWKNKIYNGNRIQLFNLKYVQRFIFDRVPWWGRIIQLWTKHLCTWGWSSCWHCSLVCWWSWRLARDFLQCLGKDAIKWIWVWWTNCWTRQWATSSSFPLDWNTYIWHIHVMNWNRYVHSWQRFLE